MMPSASEVHEQDENNAIIVPAPWYLVFSLRTSYRIGTRKQEETGLSNGNYSPEAALQPATNATVIFHQLVRHISTLLL